MKIKKFSEINEAKKIAVKDGEEAIIAYILKTPNGYLKKPVSKSTSGGQSYTDNIVQAHIWTTRNGVSLSQDPGFNTFESQLNSIKRGEKYNLNSEYVKKYKTLDGYKKDCQIIAVEIIKKVNILKAEAYPLR